MPDIPMPERGHDRKHTDCGIMAAFSLSAKHCCVPCCVSDARYDQSISYHRFPTNESVRKQWIIKIRRDEGPFFKISNSTAVCSKHFLKEDFKWTPVRRTLKPGAVPSVFNWTQNKEPRRVLKRKLLAPASSATQSSTSHVAESTETDTLMTTQPPDHTEPEKTEEVNYKELYEQKQKECEDLKNKLALERFGISRFSRDNSSINFFTGFNSYVTLIAFFNCIKPTAQNMQSAYYKSSDTVSLAGRKRSMLLIDEFFMFMCRVRAGLLEQDLAIRFNCSLATISRKIITWANFLYFALGCIPLWLPKCEIQRLMPSEFKQLYPNTRVVIDCTEIQTQKPSSLVFNSQSYSNYKGTNTFKCLLGVAPHGIITFISKLYTGCMSDVEIVKSSGFLDLLEPGDDVMADKGFTIRKLLSEKGVTLNIPHFLSSKRQFSVQQVEDIEHIAKLRIHIERMNRRIKENHIFDTPIPISLCGSINQLWVVACILALFKGQLVGSWGTV